MSKTKTVGRGFVGRWRDGTLGWCMPDHLSFSPGRPISEPWNRGSSIYLCKITIEQIFDTRGRPIVRKIK